jgi:hypothetical protein
MNASLETDTDLNRAASNLTLDVLKQALDAARPVLYYATHDALPRGKVVHIAPHDGWSETVLCHPEDWEKTRAELSRTFRLVHIRDWRPKPEDFPPPIIEYEPQGDYEFRVWRRYGGF